MADDRFDYHSLQTSDSSGNSLYESPAAATPSPAPETVVPRAMHSGGSGPVAHDMISPTGLHGALIEGARIGKYELIRELGRGGMGAVFLARDTRLGRRVAIKFLRSEKPEITARFMLEAQTTARFNHENIVVIHDIGEHMGVPYMVLEYLQGEPLGDLLEDGRQLSPGRAVELMVPVVRALVLAHKHNIVHRDLKPDNIVVTRQGTVKVLDFGIAKLLESQISDVRSPDVRSSPLAGSPRSADASGPVRSFVAEPSMLPGQLSGSQVSTRHGAIVGTIPYMSPEQWGGETVDHRSDLWAVGIMLFEMVAGHHPLAPRRGRELIITAMLDEPMPVVRSACPDLPGDLADVIDRCLIKPMDQRIATAQELLDLLEPLMPGRQMRRLRVDQSPYTGLSAFQESDADRFFGRTREIAAAVSRLRDQPLLGVVGPSGVGKSSFVRAGVVPALKHAGHSGDSWRTHVLRPGRQPLAALAQTLAPMVSSSGSTGEYAALTAESSVEIDLSVQDAVTRRLFEEPGYLGAVLRSQARRRDENILIFIDQFEELYTLCPDDRERWAFATCLASAADDASAPIRVVISIRSDFLDRVPQHEHFMAELSRGLFFLNPPTRHGLRDALTRPAEMAGYSFESPAIVEDMLSHLEQGQGALPLLQFAASKLWDTRDEQRKLLTEASYHALGGLAGALSSHADAVLAEFTAHDQHLVKAVFLRLVTPERTRTVVSLGELYGQWPRPEDVQGGALPRVIERLVHARLVMVQTGDSSLSMAGGPSPGMPAGASIELVHESLIHTWPMLRRWLDENQDDAVFLEQLRSAARNWEGKGRPVGLLWRGEAMEEARRFARRYRGELDVLQRAYLEAVIALAARAARRKRYGLIGLIGFLSVLVAVAAVIIPVIRSAQKKATETAETVVAQMATIEAEKQRVEAALELAEEERRRAEAAQREAEVAKLHATRASAAAREAKAAVIAQNDELESALARAKRDRAAAVRAEQTAREALAQSESDQRAAQRANFALEKAIKDLEEANQRLQRLLEKEQNRTRLLIEVIPLESKAEPTQKKTKPIKKSTRQKKRRKRGRRR